MTPYKSFAPQGGYCNKTVLVVALLSMVADIVALLVTMPLERATTLMQVMSPSFQGDGGVWNVLLGWLGASSTTPSGGWWLGLEPLMVRAVVLVLLRLYLQQMAMFLSQTAAPRERIVMARAMISMVSTLLTFPIDVVAVRMMADTDMFFPTAWLCVQRTWDTAGIEGFVRGGVLSIYTASLRVMLVVRLGRIIFERVSVGASRETLESRWLGTTISLLAVSIAEFIAFPFESLVRRVQATSPSACVTLWSCLGSAWSMPLLSLWSGVSFALVRVLLYVLTRNLVFVAARPFVSKLLPRGAQHASSLPIDV